MISRSIIAMLCHHKSLWAGLFLITLATWPAYHLAFRPNSQSLGNEDRRASDSVKQPTLRADRTNADRSFGHFEMEKIAFARDAFVYLMNIKSGVVKQIGKGDDPSLSLDGKQIAFADVEQSADEFRSTIKVFELASGAIREFSSISDVVSHSPQWSPDGTKIAFEYKTGPYWGVGLLDIVKNQWEDVTKNPPTEDLFLSSWLPDSKSVICQNLEQIYEIDLEGKALQRLPIEGIISRDKGDISSLSRFSFSNDRRFLLFNNAVAPEENAGIFIFDVKEKTLTRVTPLTIDASQPHWLPAENSTSFFS